MGRRARRAAFFVAAGTLEGIALRLPGHCSAEMLIGISISSLARPGSASLAPTLLEGVRPSMRKTFLAGVFLILALLASSM